MMASKQSHVYLFSQESISSCFLLLYIYVCVCGRARVCVICMCVCVCVCVCVFYVTYLQNYDQTTTTYKLYILVHI